MLNTNALSITPELLSSLEIQAFDSRDEQEVAGYAEVMATLFSAWEYIGLSENHIKQLHASLAAANAAVAAENGARAAISGRTACAIGKYPRSSPGSWAHHHG